MAQPVYATPEDVALFLGTPAPATVTNAALRAASEIIDEQLLTAIYRTDAQGVAVDADTREAIRDATCAQALHTDEYGDETEIAQAAVPVRLGPLQLGGGGIGGTGSAGGPGISPVSPRALRILRGAGLVPGPVL